MFQKIWRPLFISPSAPLDDKNNYSLTGRLSENSTFESAANDINQTLETLRSDNPDLYRQQRLTVGPYNLTAIMGGSNVLSSLEVNGLIHLFIVTVDVVGHDDKIPGGSVGVLNIISEDCLRDKSEAPECSLRTFLVRCHIGH